MKISSQDNNKWRKAQQAEKGHWAFLWDSNDSPDRIANIDKEIIKGEFIFQELVDHFDIDPETDWAKLSILDVGCGPLSLVARNGLGNERTGVDPLKYPDWVYDTYDEQQFDIQKLPFEEMPQSRKFDVVLFYNALQHFASLENVAIKCKEILSKGGTVLLSEYLNVPTNEAHIQFLEFNKLKKLFAKAGFKVEATAVPVRLPGYVERPGGQPIDLFLARCRLA